MTEVHFYLWGTLWQVLGVLDTRMCSNTQMRWVAGPKQFFFLNKQKYHGGYSKFIKVYLVFTTTPHYQSIWKKSNVWRLHTWHIYYLTEKKKIAILDRRRNCWGESKALLHMGCGEGRRLWVLGDVCIHHVRSTIPRFCLLLYFVFLETHYSFTL